MHAKSAFLLVTAFAFATTGQDSVPLQTGRDLEPIAIVTIHVEKHSFKSGEDITLTILLEAGPEGVYIPKWWGGNGGGIPGFGVRLETLSGRGQAETCAMAADALPKHDPDAAAVLNRDFIYLPAQHIIGLKTRINCPTKRRGKYLVSGFYSPFNIDADEVARLPETNGRVLRKVVQAERVPISIY